MYKKIKKRLFVSGRKVPGPWGLQLSSSLYLLREMRQYQWQSMILPFLACLSQVLQSLIAILLPKIVLDAVQENAAFHHLAAKTAVVSLGLVATSWMNLFLHNEIEKLSQTFLYRRLTVLWQKKTLRVDYHTFMSGRGKNIIEKARLAISSPNWGVVELLGRMTAVLEACVGLLVYSVIVGSIHPYMILFLILLFVIEMMGGLKIENKKQAYKEENARATRRINYIAYGTKGMQEAKDIRVYSMATMLKEITKNVIQDKGKVDAAVQRWQFVHVSITAILILVRDSAAYLFLIHQYLVTDLSIGNFSLYFAAITGIGMWLTKLADSFAGFKETRNYVQDFYEFIKLPQTDGEKKIEHGSDPIAFELKDVSFSYCTETEEGKKHVPVLRNINLQIRAGEKIALVGVNGAGKSTLVKVLCGLLIPEKGNIFVNGTSIREFRKKDYYKLFSAVFQKSQLLPVSIAENVMLNVRGENDRESMWNALHQAGLEEKVNALPDKENTCLVKRISEKGIELSGGEKQRLLLARALYKNAPVLLLDEPTAALDPISEDTIYRKYNSLTEGKTSLFVSHRLASTRFCDRILFMENGQIVEMGSHEELMRADGKYAAMFRVQSKYYQTEESEAIG